MINFRQRNSVGTNNDRVIICDCDDVILYVTPHWFELIMENRDYFEKYLYLPTYENYDFEKKFRVILNRDKFRLIDWLKKPDVSDLEAENINQELIELYNTKDFYNSSHVIEVKYLTNALSSLVKNKNFDISKLVIVTRCTDKNLDIKIKRIKNCFPFILNKLEIQCVEVNEKKSDIVKQYENVGIIIDDEMSNIEDIILNCDNIHGSQIMIPKYGYNDQISDLAYEKSIEKEVEIRRYHK